MKIKKRGKYLISSFLCLLFLMNNDLYSQRYKIKRENVYFKEYQIKPHSASDIKHTNTGLAKGKKRVKKIARYTLRKTLIHRGGSVRETEYYEEPRFLPKAGFDPDAINFQFYDSLANVVNIPKIEIWNSSRTSKNELTSFVINTYEHPNGNLRTAEIWQVNEKGELVFSEKKDFIKKPGPVKYVSVYELNGKLLAEYEEHVWKKNKEKSPVPLRNVILVRKSRKGAVSAAISMGSVDSSWYDQNERITKEVFYQNGQFNQRFEYRYLSPTSKLKTRLAYRGEPQKLWSIMEWSYDYYTGRLDRIFYKNMMNHELIHHFEYNKRGELKKISHLNRLGLRGETIFKYGYYLDEILGL